MKPETCKLFATFCESILTESSATLDTLRGAPGAEDLIRHLHQNWDLAHDQGYREIPKIQWGQLKDWGNRTRWVVIHGSNGAAAIQIVPRGAGSTYEVIVTDVDAEPSDDEDADYSNKIKQQRFSRGNETMAFIKQHIGRPTKFFVGTEPSDLASKKSERRARNRVERNYVDPDTLALRFKPLWNRALQAAIADMKGMVSTIIKNDGFSKAKKKLERLEYLHAVATRIAQNPPDGIHDHILTAVRSAVAYAAMYHYPEETGGIEQAYGYQRGAYRASNREGVDLLLRDIADGDSKKLGTVLAFFKRSLIA